MIGLIKPRLIITHAVLRLVYNIMGEYYLDIFFDNSGVLHTQIRQKPLSYNRPFTIETKTGTRYNPLDTVGVVKYTDGEFLGYVAPSYTLITITLGNSVYTMYPYTLLERGKSYRFVQGKQMTPTVKHTAGLMGPATCISNFVRQYANNKVRLGIYMDTMTVDDYYSINTVTVYCGNRSIDMHITYSKDITVECYDDVILSA
jgi:hypothetical protein